MSIDENIVQEFKISSKNAAECLEIETISQRIMLRRGRRRLSYDRDGQRRRRFADCEDVEAKLIQEWNKVGNECK